MDVTMDVINRILIALVSGLAVLLYKAQRDLVKNDLSHFKKDMSNMMANMQANVKNLDNNAKILTHNIKTLSHKVGWLSYDMTRVKKRLGIIELEEED